MASTYINEYRKKMYALRDKEIAEEKAACASQVYDLNRQRPSKSYNDTTPYAGIGCCVGGLVGLLAGPLILVLAPLGAFIGWMIKSGNESSFETSVNNQNADIDAQIKKLEVRSQNKCREIELKYDASIEQEKKKYLQMTTKARNVYSGSTVMAPMIKWLTDQFDVKIRAADRRPYLQTITAKMRYRVDADKLVIMEYLPHSGQYQDTEKYVFYTNSFNNVNDLFLRIGLAQALAKHVEFQVKKRYPKDPVVPSPN